MRRVFWEVTSTPDVHKVVWSSDSTFQMQKPLGDHLSELQANGMALEGGVDLPDDVSPIEKVAIHINSYISLEGGLPVVVPRPQSQKDMDDQAMSDRRATLRASARVKLLSILAQDELDVLFGP